MTFISTQMYQLLIFWPLASGIATHHGTDFNMDCFRSVLSHASFPVEERKRMGITDNLVRLSVGLEDVDDIIADLDLALRSAVSVFYHEGIMCPTIVIFRTPAHVMKSLDSNTAKYFVSVVEIINYCICLFVLLCSWCSDCAIGWTTETL